MADQVGELDLVSCCKGLWDCLPTKPITTKRQSVFWIVSQSRRMSTIYIGTCRWISLAAVVLPLWLLIVFIYDNIACSLLNNMNKYQQQWNGLVFVSMFVSLLSLCLLSLKGALSNAHCRLLVAELCRTPARRLGMTSRKTWHQQNHWPHFVTSSRHTDTVQEVFSWLLAGH